MGPCDAFKCQPRHPLLIALLQKGNADLSEECLSCVVIDRHWREVLVLGRLQVTQGGHAPPFDIGISAKPWPVFYHQNGKSTGDGIDSIKFGRPVLAGILPVCKLVYERRKLRNIFW